MENYLFLPLALSLGLGTAPLPPIVAQETSAVTSSVVTSSVQTSAAISHPVISPKPLPDACNTRTLEGKLPLSVHVLYQMHADTDTMRAREEAIFSGLQTYRLLQRLIPQGISAILLEGVEENVTLTETYDASQLSTLLNLYHTCVLKSIAKSKTLAFAEEFCMAASLYRSIPISYFLLQSAVHFTGFENHSQYQKSFKIEEQYFAHEDDADAQRKFDSQVDRRRSQIAVDVALKYAQRQENVAMVIGEGHRDSLEKYLGKISSRRRPTFTFYDTVNCNSLVSVDSESIVKLVERISHIP